MLGFVLMADAVGIMRNRHLGMNSCQVELHDIEQHAGNCWASTASAVRVVVISPSMTSVVISHSMASVVISHSMASVVISPSMASVVISPSMALVVISHAWLLSIRIDLQMMFFLWTRAV